ncbi:ATP-binding protein [Streptomyces rugosispiralis]|uniref:ATP-binding protein n=1 Tax=Streptomyces rugosispiralis TaxID=2967341 RepID=A0ABT1US53_9ACTN|nr:ATP-binding protein [Streptomyces rugosispiralis]MCQ8187380.1 ATP-binding protein [Streptomyces rugosispiralis]
MAEQLSLPTSGITGSGVTGHGVTGQAAGTVDLTSVRLIGSQAPDPDSLMASGAAHDDIPDRPPTAMCDESQDRPSANAADGHVLPVPHICEAVATVRRWAHALLSEWELSADRLDEALMVISELVTNAILHALPPAVLRLSWTECEGRAALRIEVTDGGPIPADQRTDEDIEPDEHGRGLGIVTALSASHGSQTCHEGITWWANLPAA